MCVWVCVCLLLLLLVFCGGWCNWRSHSPPPPPYPTSKISRRIRVCYVSAVFVLGGLCTLFHSWRYNVSPRALILSLPALSLRRSQVKLFQDQKKKREVNPHVLSGHSPRSGSSGALIKQILSYRT